MELGGWRLEKVKEEGRNKSGRKREDAVWGEKRRITSAVKQTQQSA